VLLDDDGIGSGLMLMLSNDETLSQSRGRDSGFHEQLACSKERVW
jgi:hypothetical protein